MSDHFQDQGEGASSSANGFGDRELELLRLTLDHIEAGIAHIAPDAKILWANPVYCNLMGYSLSEITRLSLREITYPEDLPETVRIIELLTSGKADVFKTDKRYLRKDGSSVWTSLTTRLLRDSEGRPDRFIAIVQDIAERKTAELKLQESESRLAQATQIAHLGTWARDLRTGHLVWSKEIFEIVGLPLDTTPVRIELLVERLHPDDRELFQKTIQKAVADRASYQMIYRVNRKSDNTVRTVQSAGKVVLDDFGTPIKLIGTSQDITDAIERENARERSEHTLNLVLNTIPALVSYVDNTLTYRFANLEYYKWWNVRPEKIIGRTMNEFLGDEVKAEVYPYMARALSGEQVQYETKIPDGKGGEKTIFGIYVPDQDKEGRVRGFVALVHDVTQARENEKLIARQKEQMINSAKLASLGEMAGGIAHEINNPLTIIQGRAESLLTQIKSGILSSEKLIYSAEKIIETTQRISRIVKSLRNIARDGSKEPRERVSVQSLIDETIEVCQERFRNHFIDLTIGPVPEDLEIDCRSIQISQVLLNLLNNAHDAVLEGSPRWIRIEVARHEGAVQIAVSNSGAIIPEEIREKIFLPFFTTKEVGKGTGLGLSVSKAIMEDHQGQLFLDSNTPHTRFVMTLPL